LVRIAVFSDLHGNLPALLVLLDEIRKLNCSAIYSLGDSIAIGPYSNECLEIFKENDIQAIIGNHEEYLLKGIEKPLPPYMSEGEYEHQIFIHNQISNENKKYVNSWKNKLEIKIENTQCLFIHSPYSIENPFNNYTNFRNMNVEQIRNEFSKYDFDLAFFGHTHAFLDFNKKGRFINPGSVGCHKNDFALMSIVDFDESIINAHHIQIKYDKNKMLNEFEIREIPERKIIKEMFF